MDDLTALEDLDGLAALAAAGNRSAEATLFADLGERFGTLAKRRLREDEREDCVQEALRIVLAKHADRAAGVGILPWSLTVLRNVIGNVYQRRERGDRHEELREDAFAAVTADPLAGRDGEILQAQVAGAIGRLGATHARCAELFRTIMRSLADGDDAEEAVRRSMDRLRAGQADLTRGNFHVILHRCRERLRRELEEAES